MWGDGFIQAGEPAQSTNVNFYSVIANDNRRQGLSIENVNGMVVRESVFKNTRGTNPEFGIDIEPYAATQSVNNVQILNNEFSGNAKGAFQIYANSPVTNVTVKNNRMYGGNGGAILLIGGSNNNLIESNYIQGVYMGIDFRNGSTGNNILNNTICAQSRSINGDNGGNILSGNILSTSGCQLTPL